MTIAEVSRKYNLSADTLRYYERIGLLPNVTRTASGIRDYSEQDCARVQFVKCMRAASVSIEALIEYMALYDRATRPSKRAKRCSRSNVRSWSIASPRCRPARSPELQDRQLRQDHP